MHQSLAKWAEKGCSLGGGRRELDSLCAARVCQRSLTVSSLASGDVRRSRRDVKTGPADGFEVLATSWHLWPNTLAHRQMPVGGRCDVGCGLCAVGQELGFRWVFEPWPEMIQGVMRLGRPWVVVLCGQQAKCRNVPSQGDGSYLGCWGS